MQTFDETATIVENFPATQLMQTSEEAATVAEYFPATQFWQLFQVAMTVDEYCPARQLMQTSEDAAMIDEKLSSQAGYARIQGGGPHCCRVFSSPTVLATVQRGRPCC